MKKYFNITLLITFLMVTSILYLLTMQQPLFDRPLLIGGNIVLAAVTLITFQISVKQISGNPQAFVRGIFGGTFLKLMIYMASLMIYLFLNKEHIHKPSVFVVMGCYIIYSVIENWFLSKIAKE